MGEAMRTGRGDLTLAAICEAGAIARPERAAIVIGEQSRTFGALWARGERRARQLLGAGLGYGAAVGVLLPNCMEYVELALGAAMIGVVLVPMNIRFKSRELLHLITDAGVRALITRGGVDGGVDFPALLAETLPELVEARDPSRLDLAAAPALRTIISLGGEASFLLPERRVPLHVGELPERAGPEDPLLILYTSGTTANPKGCIVPHRALAANALAIVDEFGLGEADVWWCPLPMFHIGGLVFAITMLAAGGIYVGMPHFEVEAALDLLEKTPPTIFYPLFPTITLPIIDHPRFAGIDTSRMRYICNLAPPDLQRKIQQRVPHAPLIGAFGMTETCGTVAYGSAADDEEARFTTCGRPLSGWEIKVVDQATRETLPVGAKGEIAVRGVGLFKGYFNDPDLTARQRLPDGFFLTGDVGALDAAGRLTFHGRFKDQLKVGGENVSALEVESFLATHPKVSLAQVVGVPDEKYVEVPAVFIELKGGETATEREIIDFCVGKIARFKIPRYVRFLREWPMSATKIQKHKLRELLLAELAGALDPHG
jgi:acyl-CoA synthetase (AMP-forming)/AMP-acid ligase II